MEKEGKWVIKANGRIGFPYRNQEVIFEIARTGNSGLGDSIKMCASGVDRRRQVDQQNGATPALLPHQHKLM